MPDALISFWCNSVLGKTRATVRFHSLNTPTLFPYQDLCPLFFPLDCDALLLFSHQVVSDSSSVHGVSQARILEKVAISFFMGSSRPRNWICWKVDSLPLNQWCYPPNMNMMHLLIPSCFNSNVTPLWLFCRNLFFCPENRTLAHCMQQEWKLIYCHLVPCSNILWGFLWLPCSIQWSWIKLWGSLITIGAAKAEPVSKLPSAEIKRERIQENWLFVFPFACHMWKWLIPNDKYNTRDDYGFRVIGYLV